MSACSSGPTCSASSTSCRDARDEILFLLVVMNCLPVGDELRVDGVRVQHEHDARLSRDCRPHGVWLLPYDGEPRARDVRQLSYDVLLLALTFRPPFESLFSPGKSSSRRVSQNGTYNINATTIAL